MKNVILLVFTLYSLQSFSQKKHGPFEELYKKGNLKTSGQHREGEKVGKWQEYYKTGELSRIYTYNNKGKKTGISDYYYKNGNLKSKTRKLKDGNFLTRAFYEDNGNLFYEMVMSSNPKSDYLVKNGVFKEYYKNGKQKNESNYKDNTLYGLSKQFYKSGEIKWEVEYYNGYKQGYYKSYYKTENIKVEGIHLADMKNGEEKRYNENGNLAWKGSYLKDIFDGFWFFYDSSGNKLQTVKYKKGKLKSPKTDIDLLPTKVPDWTFERVPIYPGCEKNLGNQGKKKCMSEKIAQYINANFNTNIANDIGLEGRQRIAVIFKIDKLGNVLNPKARAPHPDLEAEAIRVIKSLPRLTPGFQRGKPVIVPYSLPIVFQVRDKRSSSNNGLKRNKN